MTDEPIPAATVILLRDAPAFEVLMVERHENIGFAGGALVFPGGRIDDGDRDPRWTDYSMGADETMRAAQIAAIREAFEEVGVLLAREAGSGDGAPLVSGERAAALHDWREAIEKEDALFMELAKREGLILACDQLVPFAHWVAPPGLHRRFDTLFFAAACPMDQAARADGNEATDALWIAPKEALSARQRGECKIIFPTMCNLALLAESASTDDAFALARRRKIEAVTPVVEKRDGVAFLTIPEGLGYPVTAERLDISIRQ